MAGEEEVNFEGNDALEMSDEDFLKQPAETFEETSSDTSESTDEEEETVSDEKPASKQPDADGNIDEDIEGSLDDDEEEEEEDESSSPEPETTDDDPGSSEADTAGEPSEESEEVSTEKKDTNTSGELTTDQLADIGKRVLADFKANGVTMRVKNADDAIQLMQMGANYHKKMSGLKPALKHLKLLEGAGLLDEGKLNYLIDLSQKKPEAIRQLLRDSELDPRDLDLDDEEGEAYTPTNRTVSDQAIDLDEVLESIKHTGSYEKTLDVIGNQWDEGSRKAIAQDPKVIAVINAHMESGIYDQVAEAVAYERSMGRLVGIGDYEAYQQIGQHMHEKNLFKRTTAAQPETPAVRQDTHQAQPSAKQNAQEQQRKEEKKRGGISRRKKAPVKEDPDNYDPLNMSDEEFAKHNNLHL